MLRPLLALGSFRSCSLWSAAKRIRDEDSLPLSPIASEVWGCDAADEILENIEGRSADLRRHAMPPTLRPGGMGKMRKELVR